MQCWEQIFLPAFTVPWSLVIQAIWKEVEQANKVLKQLRPCQEGTTIQYSPPLLTLSEYIQYMQLWQARKISLQKLQKLHLEGYEHSKIFLEQQIDVEELQGNTNWTQILTNKKM